MNNLEASKRLYEAFARDAKKAKDYTKTLPVKAASFMQAYSDVRQPPCETCLYRKHCSDEREACELFARYVGMELPVKKHYLQAPNTKWYNDIFTDFVPYDKERHGE